MRAPLRAIVLAVLGAACAHRAARTTPAPGVADVDHVILGIDSLERGIALLEAETGVRAVFGGVHPGRGARTRDDGLRLARRTLEPFGPGASDLVLPFWIAWAPGTPHPSATTPGGCTLTTIALASPAPDSLRALVARAGLAVPVARRARESLDLTVRCPRGTVRWRTAPP